jgi:hypothetical protein
MSWNIYRDQYLNLILAFKQAELVTSVAEAVLKDFPRNLPETLRKDLINVLDASLYGLKIVLADMKKRGIEDDSVPHHVRTEVEKMLSLIERPVTKDGKDIELNPIFMPVVTMSNIVAKQRKKRIEIDYQNFFFNQQIVMFIAHIEAFIGDSIRAICRAKPQVISSLQKQITWEAALAHPNKDSLLEFLIEEFVSSTLKSKDINEVIIILSKSYGIKLEVPLNTITVLSLAEQVRHIIVHSGARIDPKFVKKTGELPASIGEPFPINEKFVKNTASACISIAQSIFEAISKKFYALSDPLSKVGLRFGKIYKEE